MLGTVGKEEMQIFTGAGAVVGESTFWRPWYSRGAHGQGLEAVGLTKPARHLHSQVCTHCPMLVPSTLGNGLI